MTFQVDAIYDGGVLKPKTPLALPDQAHVTVTVDAKDLVDQTLQEDLAAQQAALDELRRIIDSTPQVQNNDGWSVRQHDDLLYGKP